MNVQLWHLIIGGVITIAGSVWAAKATGKATVRVAEVTAESGAYERAEAIYKNAIDRLEKENGQLRQDLEALRTELTQLKARLTHDGTDVSDVID